MKSKICLIRHGITEGNKQRLYYGHADIPLAQEGIDELRKLTEEGLYPRYEDADFYTTGLERTEQTLKLIYGQQPHKKMELLKEINFGEFEMKRYSEIKDLDEYQQWITDKSGRTSPPGGEGLVAFRDRIMEGFEELKKLHAAKVLSMRHSGEEAASVVVCHGGTISAIMGELFPRKSGNFYEWIPDPGHGYVLTLEDYRVVDKEKF